VARFEVAVKGGGRVELAAYGIADAEHQAEKELRAAWPEARVAVVEVSRSGDQPRIVDEFVVRYRLSGIVSVESDSADDARRAALRTLRERFAATRFAHVVWDPAET